MILPLMDILGLDKSHLYAIPILFDENGEYAGFDITADVTKMDGKGIIASKYDFIMMIQIRLRKELLGDNGIVVNIGDGILDANAYPSTDAFLAYTGVTQKPAAMKKAMLLFDNFNDLLEAMKNNTN